MQDEDKWLKYFTKTQLLFLAAFTAPGVGLVIFFNRIGLTFIGMVFLLLFVALGIALPHPKMKMPDDKYLWGGGVMIKTLLVRVLLKLLPSNRNVYISLPYDEEEDN